MAASGLPMSDVPVIDLAPFRRDPGGAGRGVVAAVDRACRDIGFLVVLGHGVPEAVTAEAFVAGYAFFDLDRAAKTRLTATKGPGYYAMKRQALAGSTGEATPPDLLERFCMAPLDNGPASIPNQWPDGLPHLRPVLETYYRAMEALADTLMTIFALALGLPGGFFAGSIDRHISDLCLNHYPAQDEPPLPGQLRAGAHTDYGSLTILAPSPAPVGLQVLRRDAVWQDVPKIEGALVVNIGDLMAQWTNDRWVSTTHRVVNPPPDAGKAARRLSIAFFHQPNDDAVIEPIPSCIDSAHPSRYGPTTSGAHLRMKIARHLVASDA